MLKKKPKTSLDYDDIIKANAFPRRFLVKFALACAEAVKQDNEDKAVTACRALVQKWLDNSSSVTNEELNRAASAAASAATYAAASAATYAAASAATYASATASYATASATYASATASYATATASYATASATYAANLFDPTLLLIEMINEEYSELERLLMGIVV